ncbi:MULTISPECIES: hypothetical protein [unclassified Leptolyngbya]|uniref:hypothetical protein n=1 Tax=unclassified Leptolyngbya TaxID=2650499 RepID=UPI0016841E1B|nr:MULTISPECIES: hypothetical protein [unclassified Leptolyngbya]MBD1911410.1 hypothetical protein [Leptolyngbya sp. FACHB-8]MBD2159036.1 hypothetical protein [Leptolyngbya sp. FACHB-16]
MSSQMSPHSNPSQLWHQLWQLVSWLEEAAEKPKYKVWRRYIRRYTRPAWLMSATLALVLLSVNTRFVLASGAGVGAALTVFYLAQKQWVLPPFWREMVGMLTRSRGMAIAAGSVATLSTYAGLSLNKPFVDPAMAIGLVLEGSLLLGFLLWLSSRPDTRSEASETVAADGVEHYLEQLADPSPLKRLLAIRQTTRLARSSETPAEIRADLADCFRIMLAHEPDPTVQQALARHLNLLTPPPQLGKGAAPLATPIVARQPEPLLESRAESQMVVD